MTDTCKNEKFFYGIVDVLILCLLMWFYNSHTVLISKLSNLYSDVLPHRLQVDAFLHGKLSLSPFPFGLPWDWSWSDQGMQQNWGLGVPLLMLPFEWIYRACGWGASPDRLVIFFYLTLMVIALNTALRAVLVTLGIAAHDVTGVVVRWYLIAWILFCPAMSNLIQGEPLLGHCEFSADQFKGPMTPEGLIRAIQKGSRIQIPVADTPVGSLNKLLEDRGLYKFMTKQTDIASDLIKQAERGQTLNLSEAKELNRYLIDANYPVESPRWSITKGASIYNFTVYYACIYNYVLLFFLWMYILKPHRRIFIVLCLASGFGWWIRPSVIFYGLTTVGLAAMYAFQETRSRRLILQGIGCFILVLFLYLGTNDLRFGSPFEFGGSLQISNSTFSEYLLRFENSYQREPFPSAVRELAGSIFFNHQWEALTFHRERYYFFKTFNVSHFIIVLTGFIVLMYLLFSGFFKKGFCFREPRSICFRIIGATLSWGLISFGLLFMALTHFLSISSRYVADFSAAINAILVALILLVIFYLASERRWRIDKGPVVLFLILTIPVCYWNNKSFFKHKHIKTDAITKENLMAMVDSFKQGTRITSQIPDAFNCGEGSWDENLWPQFGGWNIYQDCTVNDVTVLLLPARRCFVLNYSVAGKEQWPPIRVKRGIVFLGLDDSRIIEDSSNKQFSKNITQRFCSEDVPMNNIVQYSIGWVTADKLTNNRLPIRLNHVSVSD